MAYKRFDPEDPYNMHGLTVIEPKEGTYNADPFLYGPYVFYETYDYDKGRIAYRILKGSIYSEEKVCLERPYHVSFPFIIKDEEEVYMLPETGQANCIEIYKAVKFPDEWQRVKTLIPDVCAGDSVIHKTHYGYFLFTTLDGDHKPVIFRADTLLGDYQKVWSSEILNSRPAGNIFERDGRLYKPVQDGLESYGKAVIIKEISFLPYREKEVARIEPNWYPNLIGCHTYNFNEDYVIVDGKIKL